MKKFVVAAVAVTSLLSVGAVSTNAAAEPGGAAAGATRAYRPIERAERATSASQRGDFGHRAASAPRELREHAAITHSAASERIAVRAAAEKPIPEKLAVDRASLRSADISRVSAAAATRAETPTISAVSRNADALHDSVQASPARAAADAGRAASPAKLGEAETLAHRFQDVAFCRPGEAECSAEDFWIKADLIMRGLLTPTARDLETMSRVLATELGKPK